jgi:hypothetical protein
MPNPVDQCCIMHPVGMTKPGEQGKGNLTKLFLRSPLGFLSPMQNGVARELRVDHPLLPVPMKE